MGVSDKSEIVGISDQEIRSLNQAVANIASQKIQPVIYPQVTIWEIEGKNIFAINIPKGIAKPYCTNKGVYWTKVGSDKRKLSREELLRLFQESGSIMVDELLVHGADCRQDMDLSYFYSFFEKQYGTLVSEQTIPFEQLLANIGIAENGTLNLAGLMLFAQKPERFRPAFIIKAVSFYGTEITDTNYKSSIDITGKLEVQFETALNFLKNNLDFVQNGQNFNSVGKLEIAEEALVECLQNALFHRDYSKNAAIRLLIFKDRVELISPGVLPNHLTIERIKNGNSVIRNSTLTSLGGKILPYRGIGSGIRRTLETHPATEFINDVEGEEFKVIFRRKALL